MGIDQKQRSLHCGLPAGLRFKTIDGCEVMLFRDLPFELEDVVFRWVIALSVDMKKAYVYQERGLTDEGWSAFVSWMVQTLHDVQIFAP